MTLTSELNQDPRVEFLKWFDAAVRTGMKNPEAMTLATATKKGGPSARIVLFKGMNEKGLKFYTNYDSRKGSELKANPKAAVVFYWPNLDKQVRIEGTIRKLSPQESTDYWNSRPRESQLHAFISPQSKEIESMDFLEKKTAKASAKYQGEPIPRPTFWGGYCLVPNYYEFWILGGFRFHDRFSYRKKGSRWQFKQLAP